MRGTEEIDNGRELHFLPETAGVRDNVTWRVAGLGPGLHDRQVEITGPTDRKMGVNFSTLPQGAVRPPGGRHQPDMGERHRRAGETLGRDPPAHRPAQRRASRTRCKRVRYPPSSSGLAAGTWSRSTCGAAKALSLWEIARGDTCGPCVNSDRQCESTRDCWRTASRTRSRHVGLLIDVRAVTASTDLWLFDRIQTA